MPLHATTERASGVFYGGAAKGWVEYDRFDILANAQRAMHVRFDVIVEPRIETQLVCFHQCDKGTDIANGEVARLQVAVRVAERGSRA